MSGNPHAVPFNLPFDLCVFAENHRLLGDDISLHVPVNAEGPSQGQRPFQRDTLINESSPFLMRSVFRCTRPLPSHEYSPNANCAFERTSPNVASLAEKS